MPDLESEESAAERRKQKGHGLKMLTPNQMLSGLPITLAQLKAGKNCILWTDQKTYKKLYKGLVDII